MHEEASEGVAFNPLPGHRDAEIAISKLHDYALDPEHESGGNKARVFSSCLGITQADAYELRDKILEALPEAEAVSRPPSRYGERWQVDMLIEGPNGKNRYVRTAWMRSEGCSTLLSAYIDPDMEANRLLEAKESK